MLYAAKAMALAGLDLFTDPDLLTKAQVEFENAKNGQDYITPLPEDAIPQ